jgi:hypothetical protein
LEQQQNPVIATYHRQQEAQRDQKSSNRGEESAGCSQTLREQQTMRMLQARPRTALMIEVVATKREEANMRERKR